MGLIQSFTAARMAAIENALTVGAAIISNELILTRKDGATINTGNVKGPTGDAGGAAKFYSATTQESFLYLPNATWTNTWGWAFTEGTETLFTINTDTSTGDAVDSFIVTETGLYLANFSYTFYDDGYAAPCRHFVGFFINDTTQNSAWQNFGPQASNSAYLTIQVCTVIDLVAGQKVHCKMYQDSGFDLTATKVSPYAKVNFLKVA